MAVYLIDHKTGTVSIRCICCNRVTPLAEARTVKVPDGILCLPFDARPRTPTGGRFVPRTGRSWSYASMPKYKKGLACLDCQSKHETVLPESRGRHKKWRMR